MLSRGTAMIKLVRHAAARVVTPCRAARIAGRPSMMAYFLLLAAIMSGLVQLVLATV